MSNAYAAASAAKPASIGVLALGAALLALLFAVALLSQGFYYQVDFARSPIITFTALFVAAGMLSLPLTLLIARLPSSRSLLLLLLALGLPMRLILFGSNPVLEIDFYRYLWDGAVLANGFNPYALPPAQVPGSELSTLALQAGPVFERINYRELSSIYPPLAQALFALAHWLDPWQPDSLRYLYLATDCATLLLILGLLKRLGRSPGWSLVFWWNPLLIILTYNGLHMDVLLLPLLMAALALLLRKRLIAASAALTLAAGIKLWPLLLLPFALRPLLRHPRRLAFALGLVVLIGSLVILPMLVFGSGEHSGLAAFGQHWQRNSLLFPQLVQWLAPFSNDPQWHARLLVALTLAMLLVYLSRSEPADGLTTMRYAAIAIVALFLLSPVQLPWYCLWFLPLLCFYPQPALLLLAALLPLYFLRFHFAFRGTAEFFEPIILWLQYLPPLLLYLYLRARKLRPTSLPGHV